MRRLLPLALLLVAVACSSAPEEKQQVNLQSPFLGGTDGLIMSFQDLRPEVFDSGRDPFDVIVRLENTGEAIVSQNNVRVKLSGINPAEFGKTESQLSSSPSDDIIEVRKEPNGNVLSPPPVFVEFTGLDHKSPISGAQNQFIIRADACYQYRTKGVSKLCIRENLLTPSPGGICDLNADKPIASSGAPVQFANFKESTRAKDKVGFTFDILNANTGRIYERNTACDASKRQNENRVYITVSTGLQGLLCTGLETTAKGAEGFITVYGGSKTISCTQSVSSKIDFEQLVNLEAVYDYEQSIQSTITVKSSGEE
ncbi:MAG TPA: hypothetical protein VJJ82_01775 [Candidatus Nanoarchaeia archaeon]|nr:hypothetical protein [Candidatus Nanoarchaeia archaeon]